MARTLFISKGLVFAAFMGSAGMLVGQGTGTIRLLVDAPGVAFVVDGKHRMEQREVTLLEGLHQLSIWAPERVVVDTNVFVIAGRTADLKVELPYSEAFLDFKREYGSFSNRRAWTRAVPAAVTGAGVVWSIASFVKYNRAHQRLEDDRTDYENSVEPAGIAALKEVTIPDHQDELRKARTGLIIASGFTLVSAGVTWYIRGRTARWEAPHFDDPEKVRFDGLSWMPGPNGGSWAAGLTIPLSR
ncbi:MAG: hypothetical protein R2815_03565 [Flavobacteriales bacterium]|nr:hypothetical protein [Flavobacteriales bacterium]